MAAVEGTKGKDHPAAIFWRNQVRRVESNLGRTRAETREERIARLEGDLKQFAAGDFRSLYPRVDLALERFHRDGRGDPITPLEALVAASREKKGADSPNTIDVERLLAWTRLEMGQYAEGLAALEGLAARCQATLPPGQEMSIQIRGSLADAYFRFGRLPEEIRLLEAIARDLADRGPDDGFVLDFDDALSEAYLSSGRWAEAIPLIERTIARSEAKFGKENLRTVSHRQTLAFALALSDPGRRSEAVDRFEAGMKAREKVLSSDDPAIILEHIFFSDLCFEAGRLDRAAAEYDEWMPREKRVWSREYYAAHGFGSRRGEVWLRGGKFAEAEPLIVGGYESMKAHEAWIKPIWKPRLAEAGDRVVRLYESWGKPEKAAEWRTKIKAGAPRRPRARTLRRESHPRPSHETASRGARLHPDRVAGRDLDHRDPDRAPAPGCPVVREAARCAGCVNNMKQLALAAANYHDLNNVFPIGDPYMWKPRVGMFDGHSPFVAMLPQLDQQAIYAACNFVLDIEDYADTTAFTAGLKVLWCPSDARVSASVVYAYDSHYTLTYTSYAPNYGLAYYAPACVFNQNCTGADLPAINSQAAHSNGVFFINSSVSIAGITDGTSSTFLFAEHAHGKLPDSIRDDYQTWIDSQYGDTTFNAVFRMNSFGNRKLGCEADGWCFAMIGAASSYHPGGADFAFCDGSVRFCKDSIDSVPSDPYWGEPLGMTGDLTTTLNFPPSTLSQFGIYQKLSSRNGGEIVAGDAY